MTERVDESRNQNLCCKTLNCIIWTTPLPPSVARTLGCKSRELYFTSCGSESNNLALLGAVRTRTFGKGIVVSGFEHPSVQKPLERLAAMGYDVTVVDPGPDGTLDIDRMLDHVDKTPSLWPA